MKLRNRFLVCLLTLGAIAEAANADDLFDLTAVGTNNTVKSGGSSVLNLIENLSNNSNQFASLKNQDFTAGVNYVGVNNAIVVKQSFDGSGNRIVNVQVP